MRSAGCIVNDLWDRDIDGKVERTKARPLASGELTPQQAAAPLVILLALGACALPFLNPLALTIAFIAAGMAAIYPTMKRFFPLPQLFLGLTFNTGALVAYAAATYSLPLAVWALYAGGVAMTLAYDTVYAFPDRSYDKKLGLHSSALVFGKHAKKIVALCYATAFMLFAVAVSLHGSAQQWIWPAAIVGWASIAFALYRTDENAPNDCRRFFNANVALSLYISAIIFMAA